MSDDDEVMRFEITDNDLDNEFNFDMRRPKISKNRATYGIWADDSDDENERPSFGGGQKGVKGRRADYSAPVGFVSGGLKKSAKEEAEEKNRKKHEEDDEEKSDDDDVSFRPSFAKKKSRKGKKKNQVEMVGGEIAGLRTAGYQQPVSLGKGFGDWEKHTRGIGAKLLLKMGYEAGKGLGKGLQGRSTIIEAHLRKGRGAIGAYGKEKSGPRVQRIDSEEEEEQEFEEKLHQWKKAGASGSAKAKKVKYVYKSADQILEEGKWRNTSSNISSGTKKVKVIDMTGKEQRVLSGYHSIGAQKIMPDEGDEEVAGGGSVLGKAKANFDLPELRHNIDLLMDQCEDDLISTDRSLKHHKNRVEVLQQEEEKLAVLLDKEREHIARLNDVLEAVEKLEAFHEQGGLDLDSAKELLAQMESRFGDEYRSYELPYVATTVVTPLMRSRLSQWNVLAEPHLHVEEFLEWRSLLMLTDDDDGLQREPMDPFHSLLWETVMPAVRMSVNGWDTRQPDKLIAFLDLWNALLPKWIAANLMDHILLPKLQAAVELWNPLTDAVPIHAWLHPWLPMLGAKLEIVYPTIRNKLAASLAAWHPSDRSAKMILMPWTGVFSHSSTATFVLKNILPKLDQVMVSEFAVNPVAQNLDPWHWTMDWHELIPQAAMINLLEKHFFPKWLQVLASWLNQNPNYNEVIKWYKGWKSIMPEDLVATPHVRCQFQKALDMMSRVVNIASGHPLSRQPGASEAVTYLASAEKAAPGSVYAGYGVASKYSASEHAKTVASSMHGAAGSAAPSSYKDLIAKRCEERGILFRPMPARFQEAKQVYRCGHALFYIDRTAIFVQNKDNVWIPTSLNTLLDSASATST